MNDDLERIEAFRDWPQHLYRKLGFDPVARERTFRRPPPGFPPADS